jgi:hypothetical protein
MSVVYHVVPRDMVGDVLYPLTQLATIAPDAYEAQRAKYAGREAVLDCRIPGTDLLFNDTVHCGPLHPHHLFRARQAVGLPVAPRPQPPAIMTGLAYEIPLERILVHRVFWYSWKTLWVNGAPGADVPLEPPSEEFEPFDAGRYRPLEAVTPAHDEYLRGIVQSGAPRALMFVHIPHVLVAGPIDVRGLRTVTWDEQPTPRSSPRRA